MWLPERSAVGDGSAIQILEAPPGIGGAGCHDGSAGPAGEAGEPRFRPMLLSPPDPPPDHRAEPERPPREAPGTGASIWLVRHGRVTVPDAAYGDSDVPLSEEGLEQTRVVAETLSRLPLRAVVSSPLQRARRMGEAVARAASVELEVTPRLAELHRGSWQGLSRVEYARRWAADRDAYWRDPLTWRAHGGEAEADLVERAWPALIRAVELAAGGVAVVTAHRQVIRALTAAAIGLGAGASHGLVLDPACGVLLRDAEGGWILERSNVTAPGAPHAAEPPEGPPEDVVTQLR